MAIVIAPPVGVPRTKTAHLRDGAVAFGAVATLSAALGGLITLHAVWLLSGIGRVLDASTARACVLGAIAVAAAVDARLTRRALPQSRKLIPQTRFGGSLLTGTARFAFELGLGFRTRLPSASPAVLALYVLLLAGWLDVILLGIGWAIGRCAPVYVRLWARRPAIHGQSHLDDSARHDVLDSFASRIRRLGRAGSAVALVSIAAASLTLG